jgi:hypothetical protein
MFLTNRQCSRQAELFGLQKEWALGFYDVIDDDVYIVLDDNIGILGNYKKPPPLK